MKTCCGYSLEAPYWGASNEYQQHMFLWRNKKNINTFGLKKKKHLIKSYGIRWLRFYDNYSMGKYVSKYLLHL